MKIDKASVIGLSGFLVFMVVFGEALSQTDGDFASKELLEQTDKIQNFLFGPALRIAGVMGGAYGVLQAVLTATLRPLIVYGGIGLGVNLMPKFIDGIFSVTGMLLP